MYLDILDLVLFPFKNWDNVICLFSYGALTICFLLSVVRRLRS